ncbi:Glycoside hydrolase superfamily [Penicillium cf. griseofulvum]|uniref:Probable glucan endo-1,3-beta-glucosidase eglC n=1 Tax=Penicillium cf. griseofulvum TaxID=2972120 RepID=A0A9W9N0V3_9EURO|nr:Glycoside hydrolase superfamily [Penicillium cf. griseofulvum]KAJ5422330.1 Glycoside hydrolase superfamily [Penicillium cf. griseofulvum]
MRSAQFLALAMAVATSEAVSQGFNYGALKVDGSLKTQGDFETEFSTAKNLVGTDNAFTSARLYTMIQGGTTNGPISAIPAAIKEKTTLLLGLWASGGGMKNEIAALKSAIATYGDAFTDLVVGISVGSEDLYRNSVIGSKSNAGPGVEPAELVDYINQVRSAISGTSLSGAPIGHVDTWNSWTNGSNSAVVQAVDWLGFDGYPYYENTDPNSIDDAKALFNKGVEKTKSIAGGKEVWITETGWPTAGATENLAVANIPNAKQYWDEVACPLLGLRCHWFLHRHYPLYDLSCKASTSSSSAAGASSTSASSSSATSATTTGSGSGSGSGKSGSGSGNSGSGSGNSGSGSGNSGSGSGNSGSGSGNSGSGSGNSGSGSGSGSGSSSVGPSSSAVVSGTRPSTKPKSKSASASASASGVPSSTGSGSSPVATGGSNLGSGKSGSGSDSSSSSSPTLPDSSATRVAGSAVGALVAALALAFTF